MSEIKYRVWSKKQKTYVYKHPFNKPGDFYITQNGVLFSDYGNAITPEVKQDNFIIEQSTDSKNGISLRQTIYRQIRCNKRP